MMGGRNRSVSVWMDEEGLVAEQEVERRLC